MSGVNKLIVIVCIVVTSLALSWGTGREHYINREIWCDSYEVLLPFREGFCNVLLYQYEYSEPPFDACSIAWDETPIPAHTSIYNSTDEVLRVTLGWKDCDGRFIRFLKDGRILEIE